MQIDKVALLTFVRVYAGEHRCTLAHEREKKEISAVLHYAVGDLKNELAITRRMMERAPVEHYAWRPHEKSFSLGHLLVHLSELIGWRIVNLTEDSYDIDAPRQIPESRNELLARFDKYVESLLGIL